MADPADALRAAGFAGPHACAIVTGTGLGGIAAGLEGAVSRAYADLEGRAHAYEQGDPAAMRVPLATARALGAACLLLTNASGSLMPDAGPGSLVMLTDHINLSGLNPLIGEPSDARFVPMTEAYDPALRKLLAEAAAACGLPLHAGVYAWFSGPSFETPAEVRMAGRLGADLVGMSTVPEVILARFLRLPVAALSVVTNRAAGIGGGDPHHAETKHAAAAAAGDLARLIRAFVARLPTGEIP